MRAPDSVTYSNFTADQGPFQLEGGKYLFGGVASSWGTLTLERLGPDGSTYVSVKAIYEKADGTGGTADPLVTSQLGANGAIVIDLPPGQYKIVASSVTAAYAEVTRVPGE